MAPEAAGFCCRGGTTLLAGAVDEPDAEPGLGEVGGLLAVLLASLEQEEPKSCQTVPIVLHILIYMSLMVLVSCIMSTCLS